MADTEGTSRRDWSAWLRRLGLYVPGATGPPVLDQAQPVIVVADESDLNPAWYGPRGLFGGELDDLAGAESTWVELHAGPAGARVWIDELHTDVNDRVVLEIHADSLIAQGGVIAASWPAQHSDPSAPLQSRVYAGHIDPPPWGPGEPPSRRPLRYLTGLFDNGYRGPIWVGPGMFLWIWTYNAATPFTSVCLRVEEPAAAPR